MIAFHRNPQIKLGLIFTLSFLLIFGFPSFLYSKEDSVKKLFSYSGTINGEIIAQNNFVYLGSDEGKLYVIREKDGKLVWEFDAERKVRISPLVVKGFVYAGMNDGSIVCLNAFTGEVQWSHLVGVNTPVKTSLAQGYYYNNRPLFYDDKVFHIAFDNSLSAFDEGGKKLWSYSFPLSYPVNPVAVGESIITGSGSGLLVALSPQGKEVWRLDLKKPVFSLASLGNGNVVVGLEKGGVRLIDVEKGKQVWSKEILETVNSFLVTGSLIYASTLNGNLCTFSKDSTLKWKFDSLGSFLSRALKEGDNLYIGSNDGRVYVLDPVSGDSKWAFDTRAKNVCSLTQGRFGVLAAASSFEDKLALYSLPEKTPVLKTGSGITIEKVESGFSFQAISFYVDSYERIKNSVANYSFKTISSFSYPSGIFSSNFRTQIFGENTSPLRTDFWETLSLNFSALSFFYGFLLSPVAVCLQESIFSFLILFLSVFAGLFGVLLFTDENKSKFIYSLGLAKQVILKLPKHLKLIFFNSIFLLFSFGLIYGVSEMIDFKKESWFIPLYSLIVWLLLLIFGSLFSSINFNSLRLSKNPLGSSFATWSKSFLFFAVCFLLFAVYFTILQVLSRFSLSLTFLLLFLSVSFVFSYFGGIFILMGKEKKIFKAFKEGFLLVRRNFFAVLTFLFFAQVLLIFPILFGSYLLKTGVMNSDAVLVLFLIFWGSLVTTFLNLFAYEIVSGS